MATVGNTNPTLVDVAKRMDPDGSIANIAEMLTKVNPILEDMTWVEGNLPTGHRTTSRTGLPSVTWRKFNQGIAPTKSVTDQYDETCGMASALSKIDVDLAKLNGNEAAFRASEDKVVIDAFNIEIATGLFYHSVQNNPEKFQGLSPRFNATALNPASAQIIKTDVAQGVAVSGNDMTSIWLVGWSPETVFGIYPKGSQAGLDMKDLGIQLTRDINGLDYQAYVSAWTWKAGLVVRDYRYVVRVANIDNSALNVAAAAPSASIHLAMMDAMAAMYSLNGVRPVFYMNRSAWSWFNKQMFNKQANLLEWIDQGGRRIPSFLGIPIKVVDAITNTESIVV